MIRVICSNGIVRFVTRPSTGFVKLAMNTLPSVDSARSSRARASGPVRLFWFSRDVHHCRTTALTSSSASTLICGPPCPWT